MKNKANINSVLEVFWLVVCIITTLLGLYSFIKSGFSESYMFFIMAGLSFGLYWARRNLRKKQNDD